MEVATIIRRKSNYGEYFKNIDNWKISNQDKKSIKLFLKDYELGKITNRISDEASREHYILYLKAALEFINKSINKLTIKDIDYFSGAIINDDIKSGHGTPFSDSVKAKLRRTLLQFLEWRFPNKSGSLIKSLKVRQRQKQKTPQFLTEQEIDKLYKNCKNSAERYLIAVLFSSGARASEFYNIRLSDIELPKRDENFVTLTLREEFSKTKGRTINLYYKNALEAVNEFLNERKKQNIEPEEPVWNIRPTSTIKKLNSFGVIKKTVHKNGKSEIRKIGRRILDRNIHFHLFRSSCATWLANKLNRQEMCYYFGWRFSSPMPDIYISRKGIKLKQVDEKIVNTELSDLKVKLDKQEYESKLREEGLKKQLQEMKQELIRQVKEDIKREISQELENR